MVRTISGAMTSALAAYTKRPNVTLTAEDHMQHLQLYQSPAVADAWNDACIAADGSIIRCYVSRGGGGFTSTCYQQRITDPSVAGQWSTWTALAGSAGNMFQDGGICVSNNSGILRIFCQRGTGGNNIWKWASTDNGATWDASPSSVVSPGGGALTKGLASAGNDDVFYLVDVAGGENVAANFYSGGVWGATKTWTLTKIPAGAGLAVEFGVPSTKYTIVHCDGFNLASCVYDPGGNTWTASSVIAPTTTTGITRISPRLTLADGLYSLICVEGDTGVLTQSVYSYPRIRQSADMVHWSNGFILHTLQPTNYGATYFKLPAPQTGSSGARWYLATMGKVLSDKVYDAGDATRYLDVSAKVLSYVRKEVLDKPGQFSVVLDNANGVLNSLVNMGNGGTYTPIGKNTTLVLSEGYYTGTPPTTSDVIVTGKYRISSIEYLRSPDQNYVRLLGFDVSKNLDLESRFQQTWTNQTVGWLITEIAARGGVFSVSVPGTTQMSNVVPTFILLAGHTYRQTLDELTNTYHLMYFLDQTETLIFKELSSGDSSVWTYQPEIELISFGVIEERANHIIVSGKPPASGTPGSILTQEKWDDTNVQDIQIERMLHYNDQKLTTAAEALLKAGFLMAQEQRGQVRHQVTVPNNPALQLNDVITLNDYAAPQGSGQTGTARIDDIQVHFDAQQARYEVILQAEGV